MTEDLHGVQRQTKLTIHKTFIVPTITYDSVTCGQTSKTNKTSRKPAKKFSRKITKVS